ncbi:hypothetical protein, partial [Romboutsia sp.]|uniref:hypothetical protein n=1 Tax=Romboutsia sp. TaxID=1965302 RepID=UPI003F3D3B9F
MEGIFINTVVKAHINLFAILSALEHLVKLDQECREIIKDTDLSIFINVSDGPKGTLIFKNGNCT